MTTAHSVFSHLSSGTAGRVNALAADSALPPAWDVAQQLFRLAPVPMAFLAADGSICHANPSFCRLTKIPAANLRRVTFGELFTSADPAHKVEDLQDGLPVTRTDRPGTRWILRLVQLQQGSPFLPVRRAVILEPEPVTGDKLEQLQEKNRQLECQTAMLSAKLAMLETALEQRE